MNTPRISASSYSNTAPLIWSFLYGSMHGRVEIILDNAPARSAALLTQDRVDAALVPVIAYHEVDGVRLVPGVCVGAKEKVRSVALITRGKELADVRSVSLDTSSRTSVVLTRIIFREFLGFEPEWREAAPDIEAMLDQSDCALLIGDPALSIADGSNSECGTRNAESGAGNAERGMRNADFDDASSSVVDDMTSASQDDNSNSAFRIPRSAFEPSAFRKFDLAELWHSYTGLGFIFAMWMTRGESSPIDFAVARDEGVERIDEIVSNYLPDIRIGEDEFRTYLSKNISYSIDDDLQSGMELYFDLAKKHDLCENIRELKYTI